jgi:very-short-patch-repair endonuclease
MEKKKICRNNCKVLCGRNKEECLTCWDRSFATHPKAECMIINNDITPAHIRKNSEQYQSFICDTCFHEFESTISNINNGRFCPYCQKNAKKLCGKKECDHCRNRSFISNEKSKYWIYKKNNISPEFVALVSNKKYWFNCPECNHDFKIALNTIARGHFCPYHLNRKVCGDINCSKCKIISFYNHEKSKLWLNKNITNPWQITMHCNKKFWFKCDKCNHEYECRVADVLRNKFCPFCAPAHGKICDNQKCIHCYNRSFASHPKADYWIYEKNKITPRQVMKGSSVEKYWFKCDTCNNEFQQDLNHITSSNRWCSVCVNKTEEKIYKFFKSNNINCIKEPILECFKNDKTNHYFKPDFLLEEYNIICELDGDQHYHNMNRRWCENTDKRQEDDIHKMQISLENEYSTIRISQEIVWNDKRDWQNLLLRYIKLYDEPIHIYIGKSSPKYKDCYKPYYDHFDGCATQIYDQ